LLLAGAAVALAGLAFALLAVRDLGGGLVPPRPGPPVASPLLDGPLGLAVRLQRGSVVGWAAGLALTGVAYGSVGKDVDDFVGDNEAFAEVIAQVGGNLTDSFFATSMVMLALIAGGFAIASTLRLRSEESSGRAEPVLAGAVSRSRWAASHLTVALAGSALLMALGGLGMGLMYDLVVGDLGQVGRLLRSALSLLALLAALTSAASRTRWAASPVARLVAAVGLLAAVTFLVAVLAYGVAAGDLEQVGRLTGAGLAYVPALWVLVGLTFLLFGVAPRAVGSAWGVLVGCFVVGLLGQLLDLPSWVSDLSPFEHVPQMPVAGFALAPTAALTAIAGGLLALGFGALRRRDAGY
jgi:ABC-2 type transport system permease protein